MLRLWKKVAHKGNPRSGGDPPGSTAPPPHLCLAHRTAPTWWPAPATRESRHGATGRSSCSKGPGQGRQVSRDREGVLQPAAPPTRPTCPHPPPVVRYRHRQTGEVPSALRRGKIRRHMGREQWRSPRVSSAFTEKILDYRAPPQAGEGDLPHDSDGARPGWYLGFNLAPRSTFALTERTCLAGAYGQVAGSGRARAAPQVLSSRVEGGGGGEEVDGHRSFSTQKRHQQCRQCSSQ